MNIYLLKKYFQNMLYFIFILILLYRTYYYIRLKEFSKIYLSTIEVLFVMFLTLTIFQLYFLIIKKVVNNCTKNNNHN